jgi:hypothetical protein
MRASTIIQLLPGLAFFALVSLVIAIPFVLFTRMWLRRLLLSVEMIKVRREWFFNGEARVG